MVTALLPALEVIITPVNIFESFMINKKASVLIYRTKAFYQELCEVLSFESQEVDLHVVHDS